MILYISKFVPMDRNQENVMVLTILIKVWSQFISFEVLFYNLEISTCVTYDPMETRQSGGQRNVHTRFYRVLRDTDRRHVPPTLAIFERRTTSFFLMVR